MKLSNAILQEDVEQIASAAYIPWRKLDHKVIFITGATGLIGYNLVLGLLYGNEVHHLSLKLIALVRDIPKAEERFQDVVGKGYPLEFVKGDLEHIPDIPGAVDFIIHGGSPTASRYFAEHPVETIRMNLDGAIRLLDMAKEKQSEGIIFLSSMEVYGSLHRQEKVAEDHESFVDTMKPRNSYPEVKRMVESLFASYAAEYNVPATVIRLTQTFGAGVRQDDNRVFAQFMRSVMAGEDIILMTKGGTRRCYLYTADAVTAILTVLLKGVNGEAYNGANEETYCSIKEMADLVANLLLVKEKLGRPGNVRIELKEESAKLYPPELYMDLATKKLQGLGWKPTKDMNQMFERMIRTSY